MLLLQFSTSQYCRKARLALGYKKIPYQVENLTPGLHSLKLKPKTGLSTVPVLLPQEKGQPEIIADSTFILKYLETYQPEPSYIPTNPEQFSPAHCNQETQAWLLEDWLDESIGTATRFVYYHYRLGEGKAIDPSFSSQLVINVVRFKLNINSASVKLAQSRLENAMQVLSTWQTRPFLIGESLSVADIAAAGLLSPLALIPSYPKNYPWLFSRIQEIHQICGEPLPPGIDKL